MHDSSMLDLRFIDTLLCAGRHLPGSIARPTAHAIELRDRGAHIMAGDPVPWPRAGGPAMPAVHGTPLAAADGSIDRSPPAGGSTGIFGVFTGRSA